MQVLRELCGMRVSDAGRKTLMSVKLSAEGLLGGPGGLGGGESPSLHTLRVHTMLPSMPAMQPMVRKPGIDRQNLG
jgi:hypothetical protein